MSRKISEVITFDRASIERIIANCAQLKIMDGRMYVGDFHHQAVTWNADGSATVMTEHTPESFTS